MVGTYGEISCFQLKSGSWQARARYCDVDGVVRQYRKNGETKTKARANLKAFFVEHTGTFGDGALAPDDTVQDLLDLWFEKMEQAEGGPSAETLGYYRSHVRWVLDSDKTEHPLGAYQLRHVRPVIIQAALDSAGVSRRHAQADSQRPGARLQHGDLPRGDQRQPGDGRPVGPCADGQEEAGARGGP